MRNKRAVNGLRIFRRGTGVALGIVGVWLFSLTVDVSQAIESFADIGESPSLVTAIFEQQLGELNPMGGDTLISFSGLLQSGQDVVADRLSQSVDDKPAPAPWEPIRAQGEDDGTQIPNIPHPKYDDVINYTAIGQNSGRFLWADPIYLANRTDKKIGQKDLDDLLNNGEELKLEQGATILIIHSHGTEAYTPRGADFYLESDPYRTIDNQNNLVHVGSEMAKVFRQAGFEVFHDTTLYDYPDYNSSYANARDGLNGWLEENPDIDLILDVHRDALTAEDGTPYRLVSAEDPTAAQVMLVVGSNDSGLNHPNWEKNLDLAVQLQEQLVQDHGTMIRPITFRSSRFNQDLSENFLLVEVGGHGNSMEDALIGARAFAGSVSIALMEE